MYKEGVHLEMVYCVWSGTSHHKPSAVFVVLRYTFCSVKFVLLNISVETEIHFFRIRLIDKTFRRTAFI